MRIIAVAVAVVTASSCVTLYGGAVHRVSVTSTPPDARVFVDGKHAGTTPMKVTVSSRDPDVLITVEKDGYPTVSRRLQRSRSVGRILASIGTGAGFGFITSLAINRQLDDYNPLSSAIGFPLADDRLAVGRLVQVPRPGRRPSRFAGPGTLTRAGTGLAVDWVDACLASPAPDQPWSSERRRQERERRLGGLRRAPASGIPR